MLAHRRASGGRCASSTRGPRRPASATSRTSVTSGPSALRGHEPPRRLVQVPRPAVVAQPFPELQHVLLVGGGEVGQRWKGCQEALEVWDDRDNGRLLEHDLADPDAVRVTVLAPGQGAA